MEADSIPKYFKTASKLKHCVALDDFTGNSGDIAVLKKEEDMDALRVAASKVISSVSKTVLEW